MKFANGRLVALGGAVLLLASGCNALSGGDSSGDGTDGGTTDPLAEEMRSWPGGCDVLDNLQPIVDYMQIQEIDGGALNNNAWGEGMDGEALTCNGLVTVKSFELADGTISENDGELWGGIVPWENEDQAKASYTQRTVDDIEGLKEQDSTLQVIEEIPLGDEWDEGKLIVMDREFEWALTLIGRQGQWLFYAEVNYNHDTGEELYNENSDILPGSEEDYAYPFDDAALQQWLVEEYAPSVNQMINDRIGQE
ncbi:hypothetical protein [Glycomyces terrestris]|uniref:DUF4853 domain-containing protein n=1 Tax=Glycomyces terrestris TaxID=2493553 RepID=A0A426UY05_9ACTN|nr:hypothetical protein [Glycomyces terrestris]RRR99457.1 hypothetical protein EIW28_12175 [Glycomyces terrestris]